MAIEIGTAYLNVVPSFSGFRNAVEQGFSGAGSRAAEQFTRDANGRLRDLRGRFVREGEQIGDEMGRGMGGPMERRGRDSGDSFLGGLKGKAMAGIAGVALAVGAAFVDSYNEALGRRQSEAKLKASLGLDDATAQKFGKTAGQLYAKGYGESFGELTTTIGTVASSIKGLDDGQLEKITGKAISFSQAFDTDVSEAVQSVGTLLNSGLVKDADNAFDLITKASQEVPESLRGNVLEASDEYSQFFRTLGFTGEEAFGALVKGAEKGEFGIDKTGDAIKEFTLLSTDMSDSSVAAYQSIGLNAQDMASAILAGGDTSKEAFDKIVDGILSIQDPVAQSQAALALFGTPLEDMNVQDIPEFLKGLKGMSGGMGDAAGAADAMDAAMGSTTSSVEIFWRGLKTKLVDFISDKVLPAITEFTQWLGEKLAPVIADVSAWVESTLVPAVQQLVVWMGDHLGPVIQDVGRFFVNDLVPFIQQAVVWFNDNLLPVLQRFGEFVGSTFDNIATVVRGIIDFLGGIFTGDWERVWEGIKQIFSGIWEQIKNIIGLAWDVITGIGGKILDWLSGLPGWAWDRIKAFAGFITEKGQEFLQWMWDGIVAKAQEVWAWFTSLPGWIWDRVAAAATWVVDRGKEFLDWMWQGIKLKAEELWNWFTALPGTAWEKVAAFGSWVVDRGKEFIGWIQSGIEEGAKAIWNWFIGLPGKAWEILVNLKNNIVKIGKDFVTWIVDGIKSAAKAVADAVTGLFSLKLNAEGTGYVTANPLDGGARGAVVPGRDPGRRDNVLGRLPNGVGFGLRSEEAIMVPEFTHAVGGVAGVNRLNRLAEAGRIGELMGGFARGGVVENGRMIGRQAGESIASGISGQRTSGLFGNIVRNVLDSINKAIESLKTAGVDPNSARGRFISAMLSKQGTSYVWGAAGPDVFDCSGLVSWALEQAGVGKGRLTAEGFNSGFPRGGEIPGNLVTFDTGRIPGKAGHIGAIVDAQRGLMMHTDGAGPARVSDYRSRGGLLGFVDAIGGGGSVATSVKFSGILSRITGMIVRGISNAVGPSGEGGSDPGGSGVDRWRNTVLQALAILGEPASYADAVLNQIRTESGGNPNAINNWDANARRGTPSKGLVQVIDPTFRAYAIPGYNSNIWDPLSNILAGANYARRRYGSIPAGMRGVAYDTGGWLMPGMTPTVNMLNKPEAVLDPAQSQAYIRHAQAIEDGYAGRMPAGYTFTGDIYVADPAELFREAGWQARHAGVGMMG